MGLRRALRSWSLLLALGLGMLVAVVLICAVPLYTTLVPNVELQHIAKQNDACRCLMEIPGFGPLVTTALVAAIGNGITFRKGRDLAAWLAWF